MLLQRCFMLFLLALVVVSNLNRGLFAEQTRQEEKQLDFTTEIAPILTSKCGKCHSQNVQKGELDLSSMNAIQHGGESGESAISESLDESMLWIMIDDGGMPPEAEPQLSDTEKSLLKRWIEQQTHSLPHTEVSAKAVHQHDVLPILLLRCAACHGAQRKDGKLDLTSIAGLQAGGQNGPVYIAGAPEKSSLIQRIKSEACPPSELLLKFFVKRPPESEVDTLKKWITEGASIEDIAPDVASAAPDPLVTDEDRQHWSFQRLHGSTDKDSVDEFIEARLAERSLSLSEEANRATLIRRVYIDLTGLPPSLEEWQYWKNNDDKSWYANMVDTLLESPRYGERWGRYWLDLAGYADSEGGISADPIREVAWKYRDYVINAFNKDKPYDRFLLEQIAGDELVDHANASVITDEIVENLTATGFLRMGIDQTGSRTMNFVPERLGVIDDAMNVLGSSVLGLTIECARCHTHKYDAIPHRDYYRLKAVFKGAFDEHDWLSFKTRKLKVGTPEHQKRVAEVNPPLAKKLRKLQLQLKSAITNRQLELLRSHYPEQPEADREETIRALKIADNNRTLPQRLLVEKLQKVELIPASDQPESVQLAALYISELEQNIKDVRAKMVPPLTIRALWDRGQPTPTYILKRGEHNKPARLVGPGVPAVLTDGKTPFEVSQPFPDGTPKTGRRLALAHWLTDPSNPLTPRVMVNRIWYHHFGRGLVETMENFGVKGAKPSHPELLDWLASKFIQNDWSVKAMHRLILNSRTYRQQSRINEQHLKLDPENLYLSRMPLQRLNAEALRDSILFVAGKLDETSMAGPPDPVSVDQEGEVTVDPLSNGNWRRSVYMQYRRTEIPSMMQTFDYPEMGPNCVSRSTSIVSPQSLMLLNNERIRELAGEFARRVQNQLPDSSPAERITLIYQLALSREPSPVELQLGQTAIERLEAEWTDNRDGPWAAYCHAILNSAAFSYLD